MKLRIARGAVADLDEIWTYAARNRGFGVAERLVNLLTSRFEIIVNHPDIGRNRADLGENIRALVAGSYRIYYRQERKGIVRVLHIRHAARDETKRLGRK